MENIEVEIQTIRQASRAVMSIVLNIPWETFEIDAPEPRFLPITFSPTMNPEKVHSKLQDYAAKLIIIEFAPDIVEQKIRGYVGDLAYSRVMDIASQMCIVEASYPMNVIRLVRVAEHQVDQNWNEIQAVGKLLQERKILSRNEVLNEMTKAHFHLCK